MFTYNINWKENWPYEAIMYANGRTDWDINPIIYDNAEIELNWETVSFVLWFKKTKNIFWKEIKYADIISEQTWEIFSLQINNIFMIKIINDDMKIIAIVWDEIKFYENFWKSEILLEPDWDKKELTPLGYYNMYVSYDNDYYYPLIIDDIEHNWIIKRFYDYYGYKSYIDTDWTRHLIMLIEDEKENWYWTDNFKIMTEKIYFSDDIEEIETWDITWDWIIYMETNYNKEYYIEDWKVKGWKVEKSKNIFVYTRYFEDTDIDFIVWKNGNWYFITNRMKEEYTDKEKDSIQYFPEFIKYVKDLNKGYFLIKKSGWNIVLVDEKMNEKIVTDIEDSSQITSIAFKDNILVINLSNWEDRKYI